MSERKEALFRLVVLVITGIILYLWGYLTGFLALIHFLYALISGKRSRSIGNFVEYWNTESYKFYRYISGVTNQRPFPFSNIERISKFKN